MNKKTLKNPLITQIEVANNCETLLQHIQIIFSNSQTLVVSRHKYSKNRQFLYHLNEKSLLVKFNKCLNASQ